MKKVVSNTKKGGFLAPIKDKNGNRLFALYNKKPREVSDEQFNLWMKNPKIMNNIEVVK